MSRHSASKREFRQFLSDFHDNMHDVLATESRVPRRTSTLEFISISGEHYFPTKSETMRLDDKAIAFFNSAAAFLSHYQPEKIEQVRPAQDMSAEVEKRLFGAHLNNVAFLLKNRIVAKTH